jgi:3',5'-cyclic AMP phosphodiesterase CpdA
MKGLISIFILLSAVFAAAAPAGFNFRAEDIKALGLKFEPVQVKIPGLKRSYRFLWLSDLHVMAQDVSEIEAKWQPAMIFRRDKRFNNPTSKLTPAAVWKKLPAVLNKSGADALFFGGDICDTGSAANLSLLSEGFKKMTVPFIFLREDHDFYPWHLVKKDISEQKKISQLIDGHPNIAVIEFRDLMIIGIDRSVFNITPQVLERFKLLCAKGKPVILLMHVPIHAGDTPDFIKRDAWGGGKKMQKTTRKFVEFVMAEKSPVKAVFSGHVHKKSWHSKPGVIPHRRIFKPAFEGYIGTISIVPEEK